MDIVKNYRADRLHLQLLLDSLEKSQVRHKWIGNKKRSGQVVGNQIIRQFADGSRAKPDDGRKIVLPDRIKICHRLKYHDVKESGKKLGPATIHTIPQGRDARKCSDNFQVSFQLPAGY